jgi:diguanylate cyclase (GGDEF)-like protein/PAS domain S-box-containing protein
MNILPREVDFPALVNFNPAGIVLTDPIQSDNPVVFINDAFTAITGYSFDDVVGKNCRFLQGERTDQTSVAKIRDAVATGARITVELLNYRKNGEEFWNELVMGPSIDAEGNIVGFVGVLNDVTGRRQLEFEKTELEARLASIIENMPGYIFQRTVDPDDVVEMTYYSPYFANMLGLETGQEVRGEDIWQRIHPDDTASARESIARSARELSDLSLEFRLRTQQDGYRWIRTYSRPRRLESGKMVWDGVGIDVTAQRMAEDRLSYLAYHDPLTGMPNRLLFDASLEKALNVDHRDVALFVVDLDGFQEVNDTVGAQAGDSVLRAVSKRVASFAERRGGYAARIGGDEFAAFFDCYPGDDFADDAGALCRDLMQPLQFEDREFLIEACVGVATFSSPAGKAQKDKGAVELMKRANIALHEAKRAGRGVHRVYSSTADDRHRNQTILRQSLRQAIGQDQFRLHYHPLVDLASSQIVGAEALIRWSHPTLGMQRPDIFIPLAEQTGLIVPIGAWVMREAMRQAEAWAGRGAKVPRIAINVSGVQLLEPGFLAAVENALALTGASASQFEIELTEGFMIEATPVVLNVLGALKSMGFTLAVDDFGTGYSSFRHLRDFPVDKLKIDQTFVRQMVVDSSDASIIRAIIALGASLQIDVVAEGIETIAQRNFLRDEGCKVGQGYLFSLPLAAEDFGYLLDRGATLPMAPTSESASGKRGKAKP